MKRLAYILMILIVVWLGFTLGRTTGQDDAMEAERDVRTDFPLPPPPPSELDDIEGGVEEDENFIVLELPIDGAEVEHGFFVSGRAHPSFRYVDIAVEDADGEELQTERVRTTGGTGETFGRFEHEVEIEEFDEGEIRLVLTATGGGESARVERSVIVKEKDSVSLNVYFANSRLREDHDGPYDICTVVHPVKRSVSSRTNIYQAALELLAEGPTDEEREQGYSTSLPNFVVVRSAVADADGIVTADFTGSIEYGVAGSCRVQAIRKQITATLEQFPEVRGVVISVDGNEDEALQP